MKYSECMFSLSSSSKQKIPRGVESTSAKHQLSYPFLTLFSLLLLPLVCLGQGKKIVGSTNVKLYQAAKEIISASGICTLITLDEEGRARARAMDAFLPDENFVIWFGTNPKSRKVNQILHDPRVTLYYFDTSTTSYVMLYGTAEIIDGADDKEQHWKKEWSSFYPNYPKGFMLIKFTPNWMEVVSESRGITGDTITWQPAAIKFDSQK
jgi:general stress protein 26